MSGAFFGGVDNEFSKHTLCRRFCPHPATTSLGAVWADRWFVAKPILLFFVVVIPFSPPIDSRNSLKKNFDVGWPRRRWIFFLDLSISLMFQRSNLGGKNALFLILRDLMRREKEEWGKKLPFKLPSLTYEICTGLPLEVENTKTGQETI